MTQRAGQQPLPDIMARSAASPGLMTALLLTLAGAVACIIELSFQITPALGAAGVLLFAGGTAAAAVLTFRSARRSGLPPFRAFAQTLRFSAKWILWMLP